MNRDAVVSVCISVPTTLTESARTVAGTERCPSARDVTIDVSRGFAAAGVLLSAAVHLDLCDLQLFREIRARAHRLRLPAPDQSAPWG